MKHLPLGILITLFALLGYCTPLQAQSNDTTIIPLFSCDFEAADAIHVWSQRWVTADGGTWTRVSDNTRPVGKRKIARCKSGSHNPTNTWLITPNITLPADANGYYLRWKYRVVNNLGTQSTSTFKVRLAAAPDTIADGAPTSAYSTVLYTKTGVTSGYESLQVSLAQYGGQTIRIAFVDNDPRGDASMYIDDVEIVPTYKPEITFTAPDSVEVGDALQLTATVTQGYTTGMTVEWHSTMEARGEASLTYDSLQATIVYNTDGIDTITVTAYGLRGTGSASATVHVPDPWRFVVPHTALTTDATWVSIMDTVGFKVTLTGGSTDGLQHTWWSAMANRGDALLYATASDDSVYLVYLTTGSDTVAVHTVNDYGQSDDTMTLTVCSAQDTLPWVVDFGNDFPCWQVVSGECSVLSSGYLSFTQCETMVVSPLVYVPDDGNVVLEYDYVYSFFYGSSFVMVTTDMISYDTIEIHPFVSGTHPSTRLLLNAYAGQHIRVAFKTTGLPIEYYLINVNIHSAFEPVVALSADDDLFPSTPVTLTATLLEGDTTGLTYTWTSTMTQHGDATLTFNGGPQATLLPEVGGLDTVTVWATNAYGTDSAQIVVNIRPCDTVDALTWMEDFSNNFTCWWQPEGSQWMMPDDTNYTMAMAVNVWKPTDSWLVSRAITLPILPVGGNDELLLCWDAASQLNDTHSYSVMVTTAVDYRDLSSYDTLAAIDTVHPDITVGWNVMRVPLNDYAGQTVYLAFRYTTEAWNPNGQFPGVLEIDNIRIIDTTYPALPPDTVWRRVTVHSADSTMGTVSGGGSCIDSATVTIRANALQGYEFVAWNDGDTLNPRQIIVVSDTAFTAFFREVGDNVDIVGVRMEECRLYPNPASGKVTVELVNTSVATVSLIDMNGRTLSSFSYQTPSFSFDVSTLPSGIYFVKVASQTGIAISKLVVKH